VSYCLDQLLGAERLAACLANDALLFQPKESAPLPIREGSCEISIIRFGEQGECRLRFGSAVEAKSHASELQAQGCVVIYGPSALGSMQ
jgi:hypothetical protein